VTALQIQNVLILLTSRLQKQIFTTPQSTSAPSDTTFEVSFCPSRSSSNRGQYMAMMLLLKGGALGAELTCNTSKVVSLVCQSDCIA